jgi:hypothetical protein
VKSSIIIAEYNGLSSSIFYSSILSITFSIFSKVNSCDMFLAGSFRKILCFGWNEAYGTKRNIESNT